MATAASRCDGSIVILALCNACKGVLSSTGYNKELRGILRTIKKSGKRAFMVSAKAEQTV